MRKHFVKEGKMRWSKHYCHCCKRTKKCIFVKDTDGKKRFLCWHCL